MRFSQIDPILFPWAKTHGLHIYTECRDDEIRAIDIVDDVGDSYSLGVGSPREDGLVAIWVSEQRVGGKPVASRKIQSQTFTTTVAELEQTLELAYRRAVSWISERSHTRTPVL
jgi:hypothetical protein